jgi:hypothetical protein
MQWGRWVQDQITQLSTQATLRSQGEDLTNNTQAATIRTLQQVVGNLQEQVAAAIAANSYTASQIDTKIASPGNVSSSGDISAAGRVSSNGAPVTSQPSHNFTVTTGYVACWINGDGQFGTSPSSASAKVDLTAFTSDDAKRFLNTVIPYWGRYKWDDPDSPMKVFVTAEDVAAAGYGPDVAPVVEGDQPINIGTPDDPVLVEPGDAWTVNYSQLVIPLIATARAQQKTIEAQQTQIDALSARLDAAGIA